MRYQSFYEVTILVVVGLAQKHIIRTQSIEINFGSRCDGFALQEKLSDLIHEKLLRGMGELFDEFGKDCIYSFDNLSIDCGVLSPKHWEEELVSETLRRLREKLLAANNKADDVRTERTKLQDLFLFYAEHAYLPWNHDIVSFNDLEGVELDGVFMEKLQMLVKVRSNVARRLVNSFSASFINRIIHQVAEEQKVDISTIITVPFAQDASREKLITQERIIEKLCKDGTTILTKTGDAGKGEFGKQNSGGEDQEAIYIANAGLVILHPFLPELFGKCGLIKEKEWLDPGMSQCMAAMMLQFLVSGIDNVIEPNAVLNKILCGIEIDDAIINQKGVSASIKDECETLLIEVIAHWKVLKNTGVDAFRETFLQRSGKLVRVENGWLLKVEQKSFDVLLGSLPWGIGTIKLPWMKDILYVEWG